MSLSLSTPPARNLSHLPTRALLKPRRLDLAVKTRYFRHLRSGSDPDSERVYRWHISKRAGHRFSLGLPIDQWKRSVDDFVRSALSLRASMEMFGFEEQYAIPVDGAGDLLGGAHRLGCALALGLASVPVEVKPGKAWAPDWSAAWFVDNGVDADDLVRIVSDWQGLNDGNG
jgi:hypothetical protein